MDGRKTTKRKVEKEEGEERNSQLLLLVKNGVNIIIECACAVDVAAFLPSFQHQTMDG